MRPPAAAAAYRPPGMDVRVASIGAAVSRQMARSSGAVGHVCGLGNRRRDLEVVRGRALGAPEQLVLNPSSSDVGCPSRARKGHWTRSNRFIPPCSVTGGAYQDESVSGTISDGHADEVRYRVLAERVTCARLGRVAVDRCFECLYLLRLERSAGNVTHVVCAAQDWDPDFDFPW
jgi:hypothetical protein